MSNGMLKKVTVLILESFLVVARCVGAAPSWLKKASVWWTALAVAIVLSMARYAMNIPRDFCEARVADGTMWPYELKECIVGAYGMGVLVLMFLFGMMAFVFLCKVAWRKFKRLVIEIVEQHARERKAEKQTR